MTTYNKNIYKPKTMSPSKKIIEYKKMEITEFFNDLPTFTKYYVCGAILLGIMTSMKMWNTVHAFMSIPSTLLHVRLALIVPSLGDT